MNPEIINMYIEQLLNEVSEGAKSRILLQTQLKYTESLNNLLKQKVTELEAQAEKQNKKTSKSKEVDTSSLDNF